MPKILNIPKTMSKIKTSSPKRIKDRLRQFNFQVWKGWRSMPASKEE